MPTPTKVVKPTRPASGEKPNSTAPVAPVKPACERAWPANVCPRSTRKKPTVPARIAAIPEAAKAVRMKSYSKMGVVVIVRRPMLMVVAMRLAFDVDVARHHEIAVFDVDDFDVGAVKARQHRPRHDLVDRADQRLAQEHLLELAARQFADRAAGKIPRADLVERPVDFAPLCLVEPHKA